MERHRLRERTKAFAMWLARSIGVLPRKRAVEVLGALGVCLVLVVLIGSPSLGKAQGIAINRYDPIVLTSQYVFLFDDVMVADVEGNLHVFWVGWCGDDSSKIPRHDAEPTGETLDVCYLRRSRENGWLSVVNILRVSRMTSVPAAVVDNYGVLHLIWVDSNCLWYSWSTSEMALRPHSWLQHQRCLVQSGPTSQAIAYDGLNDRLYILYIAPEGQVMVMRSDDGGTVWSRPYFVAEPRGAANATEQAVFGGYPELTIDADGTLHAAWSSFPQSGYPSQGLFYARSTDGGATWSVPFELAGARHTQARLVPYGRSNVAAIWNGDIGISGRYSRRSADGGITWSEMDVVLPPTIGGGMVGAPALAADQSGILHTLLATNSWIYYARFDRDRWSGPVQMNAPKSYRDGSAIIGFDKDKEEARTPDIVITEGNQLHATWVARDTYLLCYVTFEVDGVRESPKPFLPPRPGRASLTPVEVSPTDDVDVAVMRTGIVARVSPAPPVPVSDNSNPMESTWWPVVAGVSPVVALIVMVFVVRVRTWRGS
jgi:hypothetical protein